MPAVVIDRSCILPGLCSQGSKYRALLAFLKYGQVAYYIRTANEEFENLPPGVTVMGPSVEGLIEAAHVEKARLEEQLGHVSDEWYLVTSALQQETYRDTLTRNAKSKFGLDLSPEEINALVRKLLLTAALVVPRDRLLPLGVYEGLDDRVDQICVHTAVAGEAEYILTSAKSLIDRTFQDAETGTVVRAVSWSTLAETINTSSFDMDAVSPGSW